MKKLTEDRIKASASGWGVKASADVYAKRDFASLLDTEKQHLEDRRKEMMSEQSYAKSLEHEVRLSFKGDQDTEQVRAKDLRLFRLNKSDLASQWRTALSDKRILQARDVPFGRLVPLRSTAATADSHIEDRLLALERAMKEERRTHNQALLAQSTKIQALTERLKVMENKRPIPRGAMMAICCGDQLTPGWVEMTPKNRWPKEDWVCKELRGKPMPDSSFMTVASTKNLEEVGTAFTSGVVQLSSKISASGLTVAAPPNGRLFTAFGDAPDGSTLQSNSIVPLIRVFHGDRPVGPARIHQYHLPDGGSRPVEGDLELKLQASLEGEQTLPRHIRVRCWAIYIGE